MLGKSTIHSLYSVENFCILVSCVFAPPWFNFFFFLAQVGKWSEIYLSKVRFYLPNTNYLIYEWLSNTKKTKVNSTG